MAGLSTRATEHCRTLLLTLSQANFNTRLRALLEAWKQVCNVIPWVTVQTSAETLLIQEVGNKTNASSEHEKAVEDTHLEVILSFLGGESSRVAEQVDEADSNATIDVQNQIILLGGRDGLDGNGVVQQPMAREVLNHVLLNQLDTQIGVVTGLDTMANTGD